MSKLSEDQERILNQMIVKLSSAKDFYKPNELIWLRLSKILQELFDIEGIQEAQSQRYNGLFALFNIDAQCNLYYQISLWRLYQNIKRRDKFSLLDRTTALNLSNDSYNFNPSHIIGRPLSDDKFLNWDYLISLDTILNIAEIYPQIIDEPCIIGEIGAGWGRIGYYLLQVNDKASYNIFDIPHTLLISQEYLRNKMKCSVFDYEHNEQFLNFTKDNLIKNPGLRFHLSCDLEKFENKSIDVMISVATFQEMPHDQIDSYFNVIDEKASHLYILQRYQDLVMNRDIYPYRENWTTMFDRDCTFHPLWFEKMMKL